MKRIIAFMFLALVVAGGAFAQKNSIVGKWKMVSIVTQGMTIDLENPASMKKALADQATKQGGTADSATINMMYNMMTSMFAGMSFEFTSNGKGIFSMPDETGGITNDTASYTVDYTQGTINTISKNDEGEEQKEEIKFSFENEQLVMVNPKRNETIRLKRIKE